MSNEFGAWSVDSVPKLGMSNSKINEAHRHSNDSMEIIIVCLLGGIKRSGGGKSRERSNVVVGGRRAEARDGMPHDDGDAWQGVEVGCEGVNNAVGAPVVVNQDVNSKQT